MLRINRHSHALLSVLYTAEAITMPRPGHTTYADEVRREMGTYFSMLTGQNLTPELEAAWQQHIAEGAEELPPNAAAAALRARVDHYRLSLSALRHSLDIGRRFREWLHAIPRQAPRAKRARRAS